MEYGKAMMLRHELARDISFFGYELEAIDPTSNRTVFLVRPPSAEFEYGKRLGFIRSEIGTIKARLEASTNQQVSRFSVAVAAEAFATRYRHTLQDIRDDHTPFRRIRIMYRTGPKMFDTISAISFHEDQQDLERFSQDFLVPMISIKGEKIRLTQNLSLETFLKLWRYLQFLCLIDIYVLRPFAASDITMLTNSLMRVAKEADDIGLLTTAGVSTEEARDFLGLIGADARNLGYYDMQYRPLLRICQATIGKFTSPAEIVHLPGIVAASNSFRNVQSANEIRIRPTADLFVSGVARILATRFCRVCTNRHVKGAAGETDIDVAVLAGKELFMFECKHSLPPTSPHEMRDLWEDIEKAAKQLRTAMTALSCPPRLAEYLISWFPDLRRDDTDGIRLTPCILCSHRIFSGIEHAGIPIRDFSSLAKLTNDGTVGMGMPDVLQHLHRGVPRYLGVGPLDVLHAYPDEIRPILEYALCHADSMSSVWFKPGVTNWNAIHFTISALSEIGNLNSADLLENFVESPTFGDGAVRAVRALRSRYPQ